MMPSPNLPAGASIETELAALAREADSVAQRLARLTSQACRPVAADIRSAGDPVPLRQYLYARRLRERLLPAELFADPAWDVLLDLYASELEGQPVSISSACIAAAVPATTALRWLGRLEELGLTEREDDPHDSRRSFVRLTVQAREGIERWLALSPMMAGKDPRRP